LELLIEKLIYGGDGLAHLPADEHGKGKAVFVPFVLAGERLEAALTAHKPGFARARLERLLEPSPTRVQPGCPYFGECGGCHYQHAAYDHQLEIKSEILRETIRRGAKLELPQIQAHRSQPWNYRNRTRMQVRAIDDFALGYFRSGSREVMAIEQCPISSSLINRAIATLWDMGRATRFWQPVMEGEFFADAGDRNLLVEFTVPDGYWKTPSRPDVVEFVRELRAAMPQIAGVAVFKRLRDGSLVREEPPQELRDKFGADALTYCAAGCNYQVSAGSFFQTNRLLLDKMISLVLAGDRSGHFALDLYAGAGLFTLPLSQNFREVAAVEPAPFSFHDLQANSPASVTAYRTTTEKFLGHLPEGVHFDYVVVDPPRAGLGESVARQLTQLAAPHLTYASCDPATLARDLRVLTAAGYRVEQAHLVDLFPQTFHIETVLHLARPARVAGERM